MERSAKTVKKAVSDSVMELLDTVRKRVEAARSQRRDQGRAVALQDIKTLDYLRPIEFILVYSNAIM
jgi:hypothetical protein